MWLAGSGHTVRCIVYYAKEDLIFPARQLNVSDLNQAPFSPSAVQQARFSFSEHAAVAGRGEYVRMEQPSGEYALFWFASSRTALNWVSWVHSGAVPHRVSLVRDFERIGTSGGHKDPNIWLVLAHSTDASFGVAFICGRSLIEVLYCRGYLVHFFKMLF